MKKALISPGEMRYDNNGNEGVRIAAVVDVEFPVAEPLYWVECPDDCVQDKWVYVNSNFVEIVEPPVELPEPELPIDTVVRI
jgi:hypothetical protein